MNAQENKEVSCGHKKLSMKIEDAIEAFEIYVSTEKRLAAGTVGNYLNDIASLWEYVKEAGVEDVEEIKVRDIRSWQMANVEAGISERTMKRKLSSIRVWYRYMRRMKWVDGDIMSKIVAPKTPKRLPIFFKEKEVERIYDADIFAEGYEGERDKLVLRMLYETGMRRSELVGLKVSSIDFGNETVKVLGKGDKERLIPVEKELLDNIKEYLALKEKKWPGTTALFIGTRGKALTASGVYAIVKKYMTALSTADRVSPHVFRHTFATHLLNEGANIDAIKDLLGHASIATTEIYAHATREHLKEAYRHAHPRAKKNNLTKK